MDLAKPFPYIISFNPDINSVGEKLSSLWYSLGNTAQEDNHHPTLTPLTIGPELPLVCAQWRGTQGLFGHPTPPLAALTLKSSLCWNENPLSNFYPLPWIYMSVRQNKADSSLLNTSHMFLLKFARWLQVQLFLIWLLLMLPDCSNLPSVVAPGQDPNNCSVNLMIYSTVIFFFGFLIFVFSLMLHFIG